MQSDSKIYRFPFIRPVVPPVAKWAHYLEPAYRTKWFSNFGPVAHQFETELSKRLCHPDEVITTVGEGGAIRSRASQAEALGRALNFGLKRGSVPGGSWGINGKLPEVSAAIGLAVLEDFDRIIAHRHATAP